MFYFENLFLLAFLSLPVSAVVFDVASVNTERILHRGSGGVTSIVWSLEPLKRTAVVLVGFQTSTEHRVATDVPGDLCRDHQ